VVLVDYKGAGSVSGLVNMKVSMEVLNILQNQYPERLALCCMFNAPWAFTFFWKMISPFIDPITKKKVHIVGSWKDLHKFFPPEVLVKYHMPFLF